MLFVGTSIIHPSTEGVFLLCNILDLLIYSRKHKMMINQTVSIGILKNDLIYILLETDGQKKNMLFQQIYEDISKNLVPIRPDRHYTRTKGQLAGKYSNTHKRAY